jgi:hypothetical protein
MPDPRESIVLRVEVDQWSARAAGGFEGGVEAVCVTGDGAALGFEKGADGLVGFVLLVCGFGV